MAVVERVVIGDVVVDAADVVAEDDGLWSENLALHANAG